MKVLLSPAKSLDFENAPSPADYTQPVFLQESERLIGKLQKLSSKKIGKLMSISPQLSDLNYRRFQDWKLPFNENNSRQALYVFTGDVYRGLNAKDFTKKEVNFAQDSLRILSGLYGLLKPKDLMQPYRLEMGCGFKVTPKVNNLYKFWNTSITEELNQELAKDNGVLVNLASNEYFKAVDVKKLKGQLITCTFKDNKNGEYKAIMTFAKLARGYMARYIIQNQVKEVEDLKKFNAEGYSFNARFSTDDEFVFTRG